jgi:hypothetical protein
VCGVVSTTRLDVRGAARLRRIWWKVTLQTLRAVTAGALKVGVVVVGRLTLTIWTIVIGALEYHRREQAVK